MKHYTVTFYLWAYDHEEQDGTYGRNVITLVYHNMTEMEIVSRLKFLCQGAADQCYVDYEKVEEIEKEIGDVRPI